MGQSPMHQVNVVGYDYPGYGPIYDSGRDSLPPPTEHGACEALAAVLAWLQDPQGKNVPLSQIVLCASRTVGGTRLVRARLLILPCSRCVASDCAFAGAGTVWAADRPCMSPLPSHHHVCLAS